MKLGQDLVDDWMGYWYYVSQRYLDVWQDMTTRTRNGEYKPEYWYRDIVDLWTSTAAASWLALQGRDKRLPTIFLSLVHGDQIGDTKGVPVFSARLPRKDPAIVWVGTLGKEPTEGEVRETQLKARFNEDRSMIMVSLVGQRYHGKPHSRERLTNEYLRATYRAFVVVGDVPIAEVIILSEGIGDEDDDNGNGNGNGGGSSAKGKKGPKKKAVTRPKADAGTAPSRRPGAASGAP